MKRSIVTISVYVYGETDEEMKANAQKIADEINEKWDGNATVQSVEEKNFGEV